MDKISSKSDFDALETKLKACEVSEYFEIYIFIFKENCLQLETLLEASRKKHKSDVEDWEKKWRSEYQKALEASQTSKDFQQSVIDLKDELQS
jgi:hypothetical protein